MNSVLIYPFERQDGNLAVLTGARADYLATTHELKAGLEIKCVEWGGLRGSASVVECSREKVVLKVDLTQKARPRTETHLIVAVPRPQSVKKIIQSVTTMGAAGVHFIRSAQTEKSYLEAGALAEKDIEFEILKGLEQVCDSHPPYVTVNDKFKPFVEDFLPTVFSEKDLGLLLDTSQSHSAGLAALSTSRYSGKVFCAIGPEKGWNDFEISCFKKAGFQPVSLGEWVLRTETAATAILAQIDLLRGFALR